jgi:hypothetical protein
MFRRLLVVALFLASAAGVAAAGEFRALVLWVDVKDNKIELLKVTKDKDGVYRAREALEEGKELLLAVSEKVKVYTIKEKGGKEVVENPAGLSAIKMIHRVNRKSTPTIRMIDVTVDDDTRTVTAIKHAGNFAIEKRKDAP